MSDTQAKASRMVECRFTVKELQDMLLALDITTEAIKGHRYEALSERLSDLIQDATND